MRVLMIPSLSMFDKYESGIKRVVENYVELSGNYGIEYVECSVEDIESYDLFAVHAGSTNKYPNKKPIVSHLHGLYWTADYQAKTWEYQANANVVESIRRANVVSVPSSWVSETIKRDCRINPFIIPHGINSEDWLHKKNSDNYILWNKNRDLDVCNPYPVGELAKRFPEHWFVTTFPPHGQNYPNIEAIGLKDHKTMKGIVQKAGVYLSTTKETFGIGILEALASGVPVLGFNHGGNTDIVTHRVNGYLARVNDFDDLAAGLEYCVKNRTILSKNAFISIKKWTWDEAMKRVAECYKTAIELFEDEQRDLYL